MRSYQDIVRIVRELQRQQGPTLQKMKAILDRYDGDWVLPIPSLADEPRLPPLTPALVGGAVDDVAMRAASVRPNVTCPALDPRKDQGRRSRGYAMTRRQILDATYHQSKWNLGRRRMFRHFTAYHSAAVSVVADTKRMLPIIQVRNPLATFVEEQAAEELRQPRYIAYVYRYSGSWLRDRFPKVRTEGGGPITKMQETELWDVVEWHDEDQSLWGLLGPVNPLGAHISNESLLWHEGPCLQLSPSLPNRLGLIPAIAPHNVSLGRIASRIGSMLGNVDLQAKLMALDIIAQERAIFPDMYALGRSTGQPQIIGGSWKDGRTGEINILQDVDAIGTLKTTPDQRTSQSIDRLERNYRVSTGWLPQFGGENNGSLRTGRALDALAGMSVDPMIQELHELDEAWMSHLNEAIFATYQVMWPNKKYSMYSHRSGDKGLLEFEPSEHIETRENVVSYMIAGADVNQLTQGLGSLAGMEAISMTTLREMHPYIDNAEVEAAKVNETQLERAAMQSIMQGIAQGTMPLMMSVLIHKYMANGKDVFKALELADEEAKRLQATQAPPAPEGMMAPPEAMPGVQGGPNALQQPMGEPPPQVQVPSDLSRMREMISAMGGQG